MADDGLLERATWRAQRDRARLEAVERARAQHKRAERDKTFTEGEVEMLKRDVDELEYQAKKAHDVLGWEGAAKEASALVTSLERVTAERDAAREQAHKLFAEQLDYSRDTERLREQMRWVLEQGGDELREAYIDKFPVRSAVFNQDHDNGMTH